jgi:dTDP-4-dehydrorhamnose 3,5-epimerase
MEIRRLEIPGPLIITPTKFSDERGFLSATYIHEWFCEHVVRTNFVQDTHTYSAEVATIRGIHFQTPPHAQAKLVRVLRGAVWDIAVDLRVGSPTFGRHVSVELSAENWRQLWVPVGFGHAFCTLEKDTEVLYKVDAPYRPDSERGIIWDDPDLAIDWPTGSNPPTLSERDRRHTRLRDCPVYFQYLPPEA